MSNASLIAELEAATRSDRRLDEKLAAAAGWTQLSEIVPGADGTRERRLLWFYPGEQTPRLPKFTESIDAALEFVGIIAPGPSGGFTWGGPNRFKRGKAQLNDAESVEAANTAIALCIAALKDAESRSA
ncbi:hypothetical protein [Sinorhizobium meliloti]|uniref:hypothetical protein n=1 Tax=Rhizobium meliloti TaxID=382 RepID=UPI000FDAF09E|nr:hypothetical protein [Sinorhizobium meliloti]RVE83327.1 hypothetical protein CN238_26745 [Sinorhizobium meliloti]RVH28569.1 hypothetical protein CN214_17740 [Sinorhizobium meliloti]